MKNDEDAKTKTPLNMLESNVLEKKNIIHHLLVATYLYDINICFRSVEICRSQDVWSTSSPAPSSYPSWSP
jgi:hypothetical protein